MARRDVAQFDAETADLDLFVGTAHKLDIAVRVAAREVTGSVHPAAGVERVGDESLGGQARPAVISMRDMCSTKVDFADHPDRYGLQRVVEQIHVVLILGRPIGTIRVP